LVACSVPPPSKHFFKRAPVRNCDEEPARRFDACEVEHVDRSRIPEHRADAAFPELSNAHQAVFDDDERDRRVLKLTPD
jgi:hypothetical protein